MESMLYLRGKKLTAYRDQSPSEMESMVYFKGQKLTAYRDQSPSDGPAGKPQIDFQIEEPIQMGIPHTAQICTVSLLELGLSSAELRYDKNEDARRRHYVAKIYDPYFVELGDQHLVDKLYGNEVHTYQALKDLQGQGIPMFHGNYEFELPWPESPRGCRKVKMILMERINGSSMDDLESNISDISRPTRKRILREIIDLERKTQEREITLEDLYPRNVMLAGNTENEDELHPIFVNFEDIRRCGGSSSTSNACQQISCRFYEWIDWDWNEWVHAGCWV